MSKIKDSFSNLWYSLINGGLGGMIVLLIVACAIYGFFFSVGGSLVLPFTIIGFCVGFLSILIWMYKHRNEW